MTTTEPYSLPHGNHGPSPPSSSSMTKLWQSLKSKQSNKRTDDNVHRPAAHQQPDGVAAAAEKRWHINWGQGMWKDLKRRYPHYVSDWTDAWDYRVVPATVYMYFANILPALAFSLDMFEKTKHSYGVTEVLLSSVLGAVVFALFAAQPLVIVGVTGPITVFSYTVYDIMVPNGTDYFSFMCLVGLWALAMHWFLAFTNSCNGLKYVTRFSCDTFGLYVACIYIQKGIQALTRQFKQGDASAYLSIVVALLVLIFAYGCGVLGGSSLFHRVIRKFIEDYGTPMTIVFFTGFVHIGKMENISITTLPIGKAFFPTADRSWFVNPADSTLANVFIAIPFGVLLTILFWFDHNVSSLIAQGTEFPLRKPAGFHWDIFLLGLTTGVAGLLGIPFPNGLIPQAPFHTHALCVTRQVNDFSEKAGSGKSTRRVVDHVVEQRVSNLAQGLLTLGTMTGPLLVVLHLIPQAVLAGLFFVMGVQALEGNGITLKLLYLFRDRALVPSLTSSPDSTPPDPEQPLTAVPRQNRIWLFVALELLAFGITFGLTQTIAAIAFPIIILALIPFRAYVMPLFFRPEELRALDAPTASHFTMESVGGVSGTVMLDADERTPSASSTGRQSPAAPAANNNNNNNNNINHTDASSGKALEEAEAGMRHRGMHGPTADASSSGVVIADWDQADDEATLQQAPVYGLARVQSPRAATAQRRTSSRRSRPLLQTWASFEHVEMSRMEAYSRSRSRSKVGRLGDRQFGV